MSSPLPDVRYANNPDWQPTQDVDHLPDDCPGCGLPLLVEESGPVRFGLCWGCGWVGRQRPCGENSKS